MLECYKTIRFQFQKLVQANLSYFVSLFKHLILSGQGFKGLNMCCLKDKCSFGFFSSESLSVAFAASLSKASPGASPHCLVPIDKKIYQPIAYLKLHCKRNKERLVCHYYSHPGARRSKVQGVRADYSLLLHSDSPRLLQSFGLAFTVRSGYLPTSDTAQQLVPTFCQPQSSTC